MDPKGAQIVIRVHDSKCQSIRFIHVLEILDEGIHSRKIRGFWLKSKNFEDRDYYDDVIFFKDDRYTILAVQSIEHSHSRETALSSSGGIHAWRRFVEIFNRVKKDYHYLNSKKSEENDVGIIWAGHHKTYHKSIAKIVDEYNDPYNAVLIFSGNEIDKALQEAYSSKRGKVFPEAEDETTTIDG